MPRTAARLSWTGVCDEKGVDVRVRKGNEVGRRLRTGIAEQGSCWSVAQKLMQDP